MNTTLLDQLLINGLIVGTLYGVVAMCFVLIYKATHRSSTSRRASSC